MQVSTARSRPVRPSSGRDGAVTLYDRSGRVTQQLDAHDERVSDLVLAPDGTWAATVGTAGEIVLWDVDPATGRWSERES